MFVYVCKWVSFVCVYVCLCVCSVPNKTTMPKNTSNCERSIANKQQKNKNKNDIFEM